MTSPADDNSDLSGALLISHPGLMDPNFNKTVILIANDTEEEGSIGLVLNRPMGKTLGEQSVEYTYGALANIPLYQGGPVQTDQLILAAWHWKPESGVFQLFFGISEEKAVELIAKEPLTEIRGFLGYAGWGKGQLDNEREQKAWIVSHVFDASIQERHGIDMWKKLLGAVHPELLFMVNVPDDPSLN